MHWLPDVSQLRCGVILVVDLILLIWKSLSHPSFRPYHGFAALPIFLMPSHLEALPAGKAPQRFAEHYRVSK